MNETKSLRIAVIILSFILIITSSVCGFFIQHYRHRIDELRAKFELARSRESDIVSTVDRYIERTNELYAESRESITTIREALQLLEEYFNDFSSSMFDIYSDEHNLID